MGSTHSLTNSKSFYHLRVKTTIVTNSKLITPLSSHLIKKITILTQTTKIILHGKITSLPLPTKLPKYPSSTKTH